MLIDRSRQKFVRGDLVGEVTGSRLGGKQAIVRGSYADLYGERETPSDVYSLGVIESNGALSIHAWFHEMELHMIKERGMEQLDLLDGVRSIFCAECEGGHPVDIFPDGRRLHVHGGSANECGVPPGQGPVVGPRLLLTGVYKHYKGEYCLVLGLAADSDSPNQLAVVYVSLMGENLPGPRLHYSRLESWCEPIWVNGDEPSHGTFVERYQYVGTEIPQ